MKNIAFKKNIYLSLLRSDDKRTTILYGSRQHIIKNKEFYNNKKLCKNIPYDFSILKYVSPCLVPGCSADHGVMKTLFPYNNTKPSVVYRDHLFTLEESVLLILNNKFYEDIFNIILINRNI